MGHEAHRSRNQRVSRGPRGPDLAIDLAKDSGAKLAVIAVHVVHAGGKGLSPPISEVEQPHGAEHLAEAAAATANAAGVDTKPYSATGEPAKEMARLAESSAPT